MLRLRRVSPVERFIHSASRGDSVACSTPSTYSSPHTRTPECWPARLELPTPCARTAGVNAARRLTSCSQSSGLCWSWCPRSRCQHARVALA
eukprot:1034403-Alexandrium_andersonii.AAC.1